MDTKVENKKGWSGSAMIHDHRLCLRNEWKEPDKSSLVTKTLNGQNGGETS